MLKVALHRLALVIPTMLFVSLIVFVMLAMAPGDPARNLAGEGATEEQVAFFREELNLNDPVLVRYADFVGDASRGDLGESLFSDRSVTRILGDALPVTLSLVGLSLALALVTGVAAGIAAALRPHGILDRLVSVVAAVLLAVPSLAIAILLVTLFAISRTWFPAVGYTPFGDGPLEWLHHLVLPALALAAAPAAELARQTRGAFTDILDQDYIRSSWARGLSGWAVVAKHAAKNAAIPVVTVFGLQTGRILGGAVIVESIFAIPGIGTEAYNAAIKQDYPVIQGIVLVSGIVVMASNLLVDLSYGYFNPRERT